MLDPSKWIPVVRTAIAGGLLVTAIPAHSEVQSPPTEIGRWPHDATVMSIAWNEVSGHLYVTDISRNQIRKFTAAGALVTAWDLPSPTSFPGLAVDAQGFVYVTVGARIEKYDADGGYVLGWAPSAATSHYPLGLCVHGGNEVITYVEGPDDLKRFTPTGGIIDHWVVGAASDLAATAGRVFFIDDYEGALIESNAVGPGGWGDYRSFHLPDDAGAIAIATDPEGKLFVADNLDRVLEYDASQVFINQWSTAVRPGAIAASGDGRVFVLEGRNIAVYSFAATAARPMSLGALKARYR